MSPQRPTPAPRKIAIALSVLLTLSTAACSAVLGIGDWADLTDGGASDSGSDTIQKSDVGLSDSSADQHSRVDAHDGSADTTLEATLDAPESDTTHDSAPPGVTVSPTSLLFGDAGGKPGFVACGTGPANQTFTITNPLGTLITWWTVFGLGAASPYSLSRDCTVASPCTLLAAADAGPASVTVTVTPPSVPANAGITTYDDTVTVFTSVLGGTVDVAHTVRLVESSYGAILQWGTPDQNFGQQPTTGTYSQPIQILNSGNATVPATLSFTPGSSTEFSADPSFSSPISVPASGPTATFNAIFTPAGDTTAVSGGIALSVPANSTCAPLPNNLTLEGQGTDAVFAVTPSLNFNAQSNGGVGVSCGEAGPTLSVVVQNKGTASANITGLSLELGASSPFSFTAGAALPITVVPEGSATIMVASKVVPASTLPGANLNDVLTVTTDASGDQPHNVALNETSAGAVLTLAPTPTVAFSSTTVGEQSSYQLSLTNYGNVAAPVTFSSNNGVFTFDSMVGVPPNASALPNTYFTPLTPTPYSATGTVSVQMGVPLCGGFSGTINFQLTGTGTTGNIYGVAPTNVGFGPNTCGTQGSAGTPPKAQTVSLANASDVSTTWTAALGGSAPSFFRLSAASGNIPAAMMGMPGTTPLQVSAIGLGSTSGLTSSEVESGVSATLTVTIGTGTTAETFTIPLSETPVGAFPSWSVGSISFYAGDTANFALLNAASAATNFTLKSGNSGSFPVTPASGNASFNAPLQASVQDDSLTPASTTISASLTTPTAPLCGPIPAPLSVTGGLL
jgi:hypothetical protein